MKAYIGTKIVNAEPQEKGGEHGYRVVYADGYASWSPRGVFEEAYRPISDGERTILGAGRIQAGSFYNRLLVESRELETRLEKLNAFMGTPDFLKLPEQQQALMQRQRVAMGDYAIILGNRIAHVNLNPHGQQQAGEEIDEGVRVTGGGHSEEPLPFS